MREDAWTFGRHDLGAGSGTPLEPALPGLAALVSARGPLSGSPNDQEFVEQIRSRGQQSSPGQIKGFLPPGIRAQPCHDPTVILQRESDDVPIKGEGLLGPGPPAEEGDALVPAQVHHARPGRGKANPPVHAARLARGAPPRARAARMGRGRRPGGRTQRCAGGAGGGGGGRARTESRERGWRSPGARRGSGGRRPPWPRPLASALCVGAWKRPRDVIAPLGRATEAG